jgi:sarcosine oxidase, subunit gamma
MSERGDRAPARKVEGRDFVLEARGAGHVLQVMAFDHRADLAADLAAMAEPEGFSVRGAGAGNWYIVGVAERSGADVARIAARLGEVAAVVDQTHGRLRFVLSGKRAAALLMRGVGVDLALKAFGVGASAATQYGDIGVHLTRTAADRFEILVARSFAESLWDELAA